MFEPFGAWLGDWCVRVRVIGKDFASQGRVSPYPPKPIWTGHGRSDGDRGRTADGPLVGNIHTQLAKATSLGGGRPVF